MYEVLKQDLEAFSRASRKSEIYFGLFTASASALVTCILSWMGTQSDSPVLVATFAAVSVVLFLATAFFVTMWRIERKDITDIINEAERFTVKR